MIGAIILIGIIGYFIWKKTEKIKTDYQPIAKRRLFYLPITQFIFCFFFCMISFAFDGDLPKDEISQFVEEHEIVDDLSSTLLGLDLNPEQITMYMLTENLHSKATYILIGSIIMTLTQIIGAYNKKLDKLIIEGIAAVHTICIFYIGNLLGEAFNFMLNQMGAIKLLHAVSEDTSFSTWGMIAILFIPFHYLYHFVIKKYYSENKSSNNQ